MTPSLTRRRARPPLAAALTAALALLELAAPPAPAAAKVAHASYLAEAPGGLQLALVIHRGRLEAYACDGAARRAFFSARARRRLVLRNRTGDRLTVRLGTRTADAALTLKDAEPLLLTARRARAAIFTAAIRRDGAVTGTAPGGGVLGAHLSGAGLVGALALPGSQPRAFAEPGFAAAPLHVDGRPVAYPTDRAAQALAGQWRWIVTPARIVGATTKLVDLAEPAIPAGTKFTGQVFPNQLLF